MDMAPLNLVQPEAQRGEGQHPDPLGKGAEAWQPYEGSWTETPLPLFRSLPNSYFRFRWMALWPFHWRMGRLPLFGYVSLGELLMFLALLGVGAGWAAGSWDSLGSGNVATAFLVATYVFVMRNNALMSLLGVSHERAICWHGFCATLAVGLSLYHGLIMQLEDEFSDEESKYYVTGWVGFGFMAALVITSVVPQIRRWVFSAWFALHWMLVLGTTVVVIVHCATALIIGAACWGVDLAVRYVYMACLKNPRQVEVVALPGNVVRVSWNTEHFQYAGGQYVFLNIPSINWAEFHPFSLSSTPGSNMAHVHIRVLGNWTAALHKFAMKDATTGCPKRVKAFIEGPFGSPSIDLYGARYKSFFFLSGGIGITPVQSFFNYLMNQRERGRPVRVARFVWCVRDRAMVDSVLDFDAKYASTALPKLLPLSFQPDLLSPNLFPPDGASINSGSVPSAAAAAGSPTPSHNHAADDHLAIAVDSKDFIATEFYLTHPRPEEAQAAANIRPKQQPGLRFGRPDIRELMMDTGRRAEAVGEARVAVLVCGPMGMVREAQRLAAELSGSGSRVKFDVHAEVFHF